MNQPDTFNPKYWFLLDEAPALGQLNCLTDLLDKGRSKGACVFLGMQNLEKMEHIYGEKLAHDIISHCASKGISPWMCRGSCITKPILVPSPEVIAFS